MASGEPLVNGHMNGYSNGVDEHVMEDISQVVLICLCKNDT